VQFLYKAGIAAPAVATVSPKTTTPTMTSVMSLRRITRDLLTVRPRSHSVTGRHVRAQAWNSRIPAQSASAKVPSIRAAASSAPRVWSLVRANSRSSPHASVTIL
jgi:hypothetical protein